MSEDIDGDRAARRQRHEQIRAEVASEEAEAEAAESADTLDVPLHLRITRGMNAELQKRAAEAQIPLSSLVRRLLIQAMRDQPTGGLTEADVERIARRVLVDQNSHSSTKPQHIVSSL